MELKALEDKYALVLQQVFNRLDDMQKVIQEVKSRLDTIEINILQKILEHDKPGKPT